VISKLVRGSAGRAPIGFKAGQGGIGRETIYGGQDSDLITDGRCPQHTIDGGTGPETI
jgi:hypothetical protein